MSELKPIKIMMAQPDAAGTVHTTPCDVYLKGEADKVIAEKDEKIRRLRKALLLVCAKRADAEARIEHYLADLLLKGQTWKSVDFHRLERDKWYQRAVSCRAKAEDYRGGSANRLPSSFPVRVKEVKRCGIMDNL